jgi:hypothetical protein
VNLVAGDKPSDVYSGIAERYVRYHGRTVFDPIILIVVPIQDFYIL